MEYNEIAQAILTQADMPWYDKYFFEILVTMGSSFCGYIIAQHYKNLQSTDDSDKISIAGVNGIVSGALSTWILSNEYTLQISFQFGILIGICSPIFVFIAFSLMDKFFPGKMDKFKHGVYIDDDDAPVMTKLGAVFVGKKKDKRKKTRSPIVGSDSDGEPMSADDQTRVLTEEERVEITDRNRKK